MIRSMFSKIFSNAHADDSYSSLLIYQVNCHACIGGKSLGGDLKELERGGVQVISGTPGRVYDLIRRNALRMTQLKVLVLDEADEMLNRGFKEQIYDIYRFLPVACQVVLMSATLPASVLEMTQKFMSDPIKILVKRDELTLGESISTPFSESSRLLF